MTRWGQKQSNRIATPVSRRRILQGTAGVVLVSAASGSASAESDSPVEYRTPESRRVWQGQRVFAFGSGIEADTNYQLRRVTAQHDGTVTESEFVGEFAAVAAADIETTFSSTTIEEFDLEAVGDVIEIQTDDASAGDYFVRGGSLAGAGDLPLAETFEIIRQQLQVGFDSESVKQGQATTLEIDSNRATFELLVGAETLAAATLERMFVEEGGFELAATQPGDDRLRIHAERRLSEAVVATDIEPGEYALTFQAVDTTATESATLTVEGEAGGPIEGLVWQGQTVVSDDSRIEPNTAYEIREVKEIIDGQVEQSSFAMEVLANDDGEITVETASLSTGDYFIRGGVFPTTPELAETFEIVAQRLGVTIEPTDLAASETATLEFESNRAEYNVVVAADGELNTDQLRTLLVESGDFALIDDHGTADRIEIEASNTAGELTIEGLPVGTYTLSFTVPDTGVQETVTIAIEEGDESAVADYAAADGRVDTTGLREAIDDWRSGDIDISLLRDVIDAWRTGEVV